MDTNHQHFIKLDELRKEYNFTLDTFCEDICSDRQYRRYLNGDSIIAPNRFSMFLKKLTLTPDEFYSLFYKSENVTYKKIANLYNLITTKQYDKAESEQTILRKSKITGHENTRFFELCDIMLQSETNKITKYHAVDKLKGLIQYPECLNKNHFTFIELEAMNNIVSINGSMKLIDDAFELKKILEKETFLYLSSNTRYMLPAIYLTLSRTLGMNKFIKEALEVATEGINYSLKVSDNKYLIDLRYIQSLAYYSLGQKTEAFESAKKCIATCISTNNEHKYTKYNQLFLKEQGYTFELTTKYE